MFYYSIYYYFKFTFIFYLAFIFLFSVIFISFVLFQLLAKGTCLVVFFKYFKFKFFI